MKDWRLRLALGVVSAFLAGCDGRADEASASTDSEQALRLCITTASTANCLVVRTTWPVAHFTLEVAVWKEDTVIRHTPAHELEVQRLNTRAGCDAAPDRKLSS